MDRQFGRKKLEHLGNLECSSFSGTLQRDCGYGKKSPENLRLELDEKAISALEAHVVTIARIPSVPMMILLISYDILLKLIREEMREKGR